MAIQGRLTREKLGFSAPVDAPLYQAPPFHYRNITMLSFEYQTEAAAAAELLPEPFELVEPARAALTLGDYPWTTFGPYHEAFLGVACHYRGRPLLYVSHVFLDSEPALAAGREIWGIPKKLAHIEFVKEAGQWLGKVERPRGLVICTGVLRPERPLDPGDFEAVPLACLRVVPSPEAGAPPSALELVEVDVEYRPKELWAGPGSCHFTGASELDPWHKLPVRSVPRCVLAVHDLELRYGTVLEKL